MAGRQGGLLLIFLISAHFLPPFELGRISYAISIVSLLSILSDFGISTAVSNYVAEYFHLDKDKLRSLFLSSASLVLGITFAIALILLVGGKYIFGDSIRDVWLFFPLTFLIPLVSIYDGFFRGLSNFKRISIVTFVTAVATIPIAYILVGKYGFFGAAISQLIFYTLNLGLSALLFEFHSWNFDRSVLVSVLRYSLIIGFTNLSYFLITRVGVTLLGFFGYIEVAAYYDLVSRILMLVLNVFATFGVVIAPAKIHQYLQSYEGLREDVRTHLRGFSIIALLTTALFFFVTPMIIEAVAPQYSNETFAKILLFFLAVLPLYILESVLANGFITPLGKASILLRATIVGGIANVLLAVFLVPHMGPWGVLWAFAIVNNFVNLYKIFSFYNFSAKAHPKT